MTRILAALLAFFSFLSLAAAADHPTSQVRGRVMDTKGAPIAGVAVTLRSVDGPWVSGPAAEGLAAPERNETVTNEDGWFSFDVPCPTSSWVSLNLRPGEFHGITGRDFGVAGGRNKDPLRPGLNDLGDFVLPDTGAVSGRVLDDEGNSVASAYVRLRDSFPGGYEIGTESDVDGTFLLGHVPAGTYWIDAVHDAYLINAVAGVVVEDGRITQDVKFRLKDAPILAGIVIDEEGNPLEDVRVWGWPERSGRGAGADSGSDGRFVITLPQNDPYRLEATLLGYEDFDEGIDSGGHPPGSTDVRIVMRALPVTTFMVVDAESGEPIEDFGLQLDDAEKPGHEEAMNSNHPDLQIYRFPGGAAEWWARPGLHDYLVQAPGYAPQRGPVIHEASDRPRQVIRLVKGSRAIGDVSAAGLPRGGLTVHLDRVRSSGLDDFVGRRRTTVTGDDGRFAFSDLAAGRYDLLVSGSGVAPLRLEDVRIRVTETTDVGLIEVLPAGSIDGVVRVADGLSAAGLVVYLDNMFDDVFCSTDHEGGFRFTDLADGWHLLIVEEKDDVAAGGEPFPVEVVSGEVTHVTLDVSDRVPRGVSARPLIVRVEVNGRPVAGLQVLAGGKCDDGEWYRGDETDAAGRVQVEIPSESQLSCVDVRSAAGLPLARRLLGPDQQGEVFISVEAGTLIVELPEGSVVPEGAVVIVSVAPPDAGRGGPGCGSVSMARGGSRYELGFVATGRLEVSVGGDVSPCSKTVDVKPGEETVCVMTIEDVE
ncbi:MAG: carboxypeptidase regulatory-like domain-containing protein [Planctomycetes bacterium]|nr:carboxypeptidase regulatory-like domain-containing protein [Planctomycetota bacterium]